MDSILSIAGYEEELPVTNHHDIYSAIDPKEAFANQTYRGKVVLITGASRGIGQETAITYAKAGAHVAIAGRSQETLDKTAAIIHAARQQYKPHSSVSVGLDVLIANAGARWVTRSLISGGTQFEVNVRGVYNTVRRVFAVFSFQRSGPNRGPGPRYRRSRRLAGVSWSFSSNAAQLRIPHASDYAISKHAINRLVEFIALEYPKLTVFALHPGSIKTQMVEESCYVFPDDFPNDTLQLPAATMLYLTSGQVDWFNGKYLAATWDISEIERDWKEKVRAGGVLISKLAIPK
ncbi:NAD-P-binding protein [Lactarius deliciosus]|nr:NAD-P-binding protein [Lactarius deliciosus]